MNEELVDQYITLRALVAYLGEKTQYNWWNTNFLSRAGLQFFIDTFSADPFRGGPHLGYRGGSPSA